MIESKVLAGSERKFSDLALDGLFGGLAGGAAMALYLVLWGSAAGQPAGDVLRLFGPNGPVSVLSGALMHLAVAAVYGIGFGALWWALGRVRRARVPGWLAGLLYGVLLLAAAKLLLLPGSGSALAEIPTLHFAIAHAAYGAALGAVSARLHSSETGHM